MMKFSSGNSAMSSAKAPALQLTAEEIANVMAPPRSVRIEAQALPPNETFEESFHQGVRCTSTRQAHAPRIAETFVAPESCHAIAADARQVSNDFRNGYHDPLASSRKGVQAHSASTTPRIQRSSPRADNMTLYGPAPCPTADSMVIRNDSDSLWTSCSPSIAMTPYGPAPDLGSFDAQAWAEEKQRHQQLVYQQQRRYMQQHQSLHEQEQLQLVHNMQLESQRDLMRQQKQQQCLPRLCSTMSATMERESEHAVGDLLDQHVEYYLSCHPGVRESHRIQKKRAGCYEISGREITLDWQHDDSNGGDGFLVVVDGPLRQAFKDYVSGRDAGSVYNAKGLKQSNLHQVPEDSRITFQDQGAHYSRLEAMKVAKEQAAFREKAASCVTLGQTVPSDIFDKYKVALDAKLGKSRKNYENAKKRWSKKAQEEGKTKMYPADAPPGMYAADGSEVVQRNYKERYGGPH